ncbi:MAG: HAD-IIA family hydrolase [Frankiaceae bacterium]|nr:HAD-IIA family hydrolase [Frankiaceae bacterium]
MSTDPAEPGATRRQGDESTNRLTLSGSRSTLVADHDALLVDLDGVVHLGDQPIPGAAEALNHARSGGLTVAYVTNNASRTPADVARSLTAYGLQVAADDVVTSSVVAARLLAERLPVGAAVLVVGGEGLRAPLAAAGLRPVAVADGAQAVVQGWAPEVGWAQLAEGAVAVRAGAPWVATNLDRTLPSPRGPLPGNGSMVAALVSATGREPESVGKPEPAMFTGAVAAVGARRPLVVGDRLDTDIAGAGAAGYPSLAVLTGVSSPRDLLAAGPGERPSYLGRDLGALHIRHDAPTLGDDGARCGDVTVSDRGEVSGTSGGDGLDGLRAACALAWSGRLAPESHETVLSNLGLN